MKGLKTWIAVLGAVMGAVLAPARGQEGAGALQGTVRLGEAPLAGARVVLASSADSRFRREASTDAGGSFLAQDVPLGVVKIAVFAGGRFVARGEAILERSGETVTVLLQKEP